MIFLMYVNFHHISYVIIQNLYSFYNTSTTVDKTHVQVDQVERRISYIKDSLNTMCDDIASIDEVLTDNF